MELVLQKILSSSNNRHDNHNNYNSNKVTTLLSKSARKAMLKQRPVLKQGKSWSYSRESWKRRRMSWLNLVKPTLNSVDIVACSKSASKWWT